MGWIILLLQVASLVVLVQACVVVQWPTRVRGDPQRGLVWGAGLGCLAGLLTWIQSFFT